MNKEIKCYFHPKELVIGICALCLNQRLLLLTAANNKSKQRKKIFALSSIFFNQNRKPRQDHRYGLASSSSPEESFISIKFEEDGVTSWEKGKVSELPIDPQCNMLTETEDKDMRIKGVVELHAKPRAMLRWRRRIGHLFQLIRLKKSTKPRRSKECRGPKSNKERDI